MPKLKNICFHLLIMSLFVGFVIAIRFKPITESFELDYDEGLNLIKALLYSQGFSLYTQIWNDQPPLFTVLLSYWFSLFGQSVFAARFLVLLFSALLVWCFFQIIRSSLGIIPALAGVVLLFTSWLFIRVSISVMIGIPSLSLAMLSIYFLTLYKQQQRKFLLVLSGVALALSVQTKMFTVFLIPLTLLYLVDFTSKEINFKKPKQVFNSFLIWLGSFFAIYSLIGLWCNSFNYEQIVKAHIGMDETKGFPTLNTNNTEFLKFLLIQDFDYVILAIIGILAIILKKQRNGLLPLTWLGTTILLFLIHKPLWYHHYPLLAIPISWLAAYAVALLVDYFRQGVGFNYKPTNIKKLIFPCLGIALLIVSMVAIPAKPKGKPPKNLEVMEIVQKYKESTQWMFTDRPIYAFKAGLPVPPEIAVFSEKRLNSGNVSSDYLVSILQTYRPEQILFARWTQRIKSDTKLSAYIDANYSKTYEDDKGTVAHYLIEKVPK